MSSVEIRVKVVRLILADNYVLEQPYLFANNRIVSPLIMKEFPKLVGMAHLSESLDKRNNIDRRWRILNCEREKKSTMRYIICSHSTLIQLLYVFLLVIDKNCVHLHLTNFEFNLRRDKRSIKSKWIKRI